MENENDTNGRRERIANDDLLCPFESLETAIACHSRDWSTHHRDAWIWGIVCGWDEASMIELREQHHWDDKTVDRLKHLHAKFKASWHNVQEDTTSPAEKTPLQK